MSGDIGTLQEKSFSIIVNEFSRYTSAYLTTTDDKLKRNLLFLQRVYSQSLFAELEKNGDLEEEHLDFLLNEYLKELDVGSLLNYSEKEDIVKKVSLIAHSIVDLSCIEGTDVDGIYLMMELLPQTTNVKKISIPFICNDEILKLIASSCPQLTELNIEESSFSKNGLQALYFDNGVVKARCPLKHLNLLETTANCEDVEILLRNIPTLEELLFIDLPNVLHSIHQTDIKNGLNHFKKYNLTRLEFSPMNESVTLGSLLTLCAELCPRIKNLSIPATRDEEMQLCNLFPELEFICINRDDMEYEDTFNLDNFLLSKGAKLKSLTASFCSLSMPTLIKSCPNLETLTLKNIQYKKCDAMLGKALHSLRTLQLLFISFTNINCAEAVISLINSSPNLEELSLEHCNFSESEIVAKLSKYSLNCKLKHLTFSYSDVVVDLLQQIILNCSSLKTLSLDNCNNICTVDIDMINQTIEATNRKIEIIFEEDQSDVSYSDYDFDYDVYDGFDVYDGYEYGYGDYDDDDDEYDDTYEPDDW